MTALARIHVARKQLGLDDDTYRDILERTVGQRTAKGLSEAQCGQVLDEFKRLGFRPAAGGKRKKLDGKYAAKLQALWIAGWNLGIIRDRHDRALLKFVKGRTGLDHTRFLHHHDDATTAIEALKAWLAHEGGVDWGARNKPDGRKIAEAQWNLLGENPGIEFRDQVLALTGASFILDIDSKGWITVMNALGKKVRAQT